MNTYSLEGGVTINRTQIRELTTNLPSLHIPEDDFNNRLCVVPKDFSEHARNDYGQLGIRTYEPNNSHAVLHAPAWGGTFESPITNVENQKLSYLLPGAALISFNMPGHGEHYASSPWPKNARRDLRTNSSFMAAGKHIGNLLARNADFYDTLDVVGFSTGGRTVLGITTELKRDIGTVVVYDPPGSRHYSYREFARQYREKEGAHALSYREHSKDEEFQTLINNSTRHKKEGILANIRNGSLLDYYFWEPRALAHGTLAADLRRTNFHSVNRFVFISPTGSELNDPVDVHKILQNTATKNKGTTFEHWTFNGTHAFSRVGSMAIARLFEVALQPPEEYHVHEK